MTESSSLAVVVDKPETGAVIDALRSIGRYDDNRGVRERDDTTTEVPITGTDTDEEPLRTAGDIGDCPEWLADRPVVRQLDPVTRTAGLRDRLRDQGFTDDMLDSIPNSWAVVGDIILVRFPADCVQQRTVAEALLDLHGAETVLDRGGIDGPHREPEVSVVAGTGATETIHTEHGTKYALDLAEVMFSPGNKAERVRMGEVVEPAESVLDCFAGIGYFALPMARAGARVTAIERNPTAFQYLIENGSLNDIETRLTPIRGDTGSVVPDLLAGDFQPVDRLVMGHYDAIEYLDVVLPALSSGGTVHLHAAVPEPELWERPLDRFRNIINGHARSVEAIDRRQVKTYAEGVVHVVIDAAIR